MLQQKSIKLEICDKEYKNFKASYIYFKVSFHSVKVKAPILLFDDFLIYRFFFLNVVISSYFMSQSQLLNKLPQTGWLKNNRNLILTVVEAESLRSGCRHGGGKALFWTADFSLYPHMVKGLGTSVGSLFQEHKFQSCRLHLMGAPPSVITLGVLIPAFEFWVDTDFQATVLYMISIMSYV